MTNAIQDVSFDRAIAFLARRSVADFSETAKVIADLFGVSPQCVSDVVAAHWDKTDPFRIVGGKLLVRIGVDGKLLDEGIDGDFALVEFGEADADGIAILSAPATLLERCAYLQSDCIGGQLEEVRGWLEAKGGYQVAGG